MFPQGMMPHGSYGHMPNNDDFPALRAAPKVPPHVAPNVAPRPPGRIHQNGPPPVGARPPPSGNPMMYKSHPMMSGPPSMVHPSQMSTHANMQGNIANIPHGPAPGTVNMHHGVMPTHGPPSGMLPMQPPISTIPMGPPGGPMSMMPPVYPSNARMPPTSLFAPGNVLANSTIPDDASKGVRQDTKVEREFYGLMGILKVIRMTDPDLNTLALGIDLTSLGLDLNSPECLYASFLSPWSGVPARKDPEYCLPKCYYMQPPAMKSVHLQKFTLETLCYIFHHMPGDMLQALVAQELYNRKWFFHSELQYWFEKSDDPSKAPWSYFDPQIWGKRDYWEQLDESKFLTEADVRIPRDAVGPSKS